MPNAQSTFEEHDAHKIRIVQQWREDASLMVLALQCGHCGYSSTVQITVDSISGMDEDQLDGVVLQATSA